MKPRRDAPDNRPIIHRTSLSRPGFRVRPFTVPSHAHRFLSTPYAGNRRVAEPGSQALVLWVVTDGTAWHENQSPGLDVSMVFEVLTAGADRMSPGSSNG